MANFQTHLNVGIVVSAATTLGLFTAGLMRSEQTAPFFALGVLGSLLPDIDSDTSRPVNALFAVLGAGLAFVMTLPLIHHFPPLHLALIWAFVYLCVRYGFFEIFARLTVHRGVWHSWLAAAAVTLATVDLAYWFWLQSPRTAWVAGAMVGIGYLTHLVLDEIYSVDLFNSRIKRSFGTALKPFSLDHPWSSLAMLTVALALAWLAPPSAVLLELARLENPLDLDGLVEALRDALAGVWSALPVGLKGALP